MKLSILQRMIHDRGGNFGIMTAVLLPVLVGAAGMAIDLTNAMQTRSSMQGFADAAALAAASAMADKGISKEDAEAYALNVIASQVVGITGDTGQEASDLADDVKKNTGVNVSESGSATSGMNYTVKVKSAIDLPLTGMTAILGFKTMRVEVSGTATSSTKAQNALSMYLVLDRSGSMGDNTDTVNTAQPTKCKTTNSDGSCKTTTTNYVIKIDALKLAVNSLLDTIKTADPDNMYARLGSVSYNDKMQTPEPLGWGTTKVSTYVSKLTASGSTNSGDAMQTAYSSLAAPGETAAHKAKNGQTNPSKFIIFMTDGENNISGADAKTKTACAAAKAAGIQVYSVAFMAPAAGQNLLKTCATDSSHYYDAKDAVGLIAAFKSIGEKASQVGTRLTN